MNENKPVIMSLWKISGAGSSISMKSILYLIDEISAEAVHFCFEKYNEKNFWLKNISSSDYINLADKMSEEESKKLLDLLMIKDILL